MLKMGCVLLSLFVLLYSIFRRVSNPMAFSFSKRILHEMVRCFFSLSPKLLFFWHTSSDWCLQVLSMIMMIGASQDLIHISRSYSIGVAFIFVRWRSVSIFLKSENRKLGNLTILLTSKKSKIGKLTFHFGIEWTIFLQEQRGMPEELFQVKMYALVDDVSKSQNLRRRVPVNKPGIIK